MTERSHVTTAAEAEALYRVFFGTQPPPEVLARYAAANLHCFGEAADDPVTATVISRRLDAEAVELALRRSNSLLTQKIQILFYLAEVRSEHYGAFFSREESVAAAIIGLSAAVLRSGWKLLKGHYLVRRYGLV